MADASTQTETTSRRTRIGVVTCALVALVVLASFGVDRWRHAGRVLGGVRIAGEAFSGLTRGAAEERARELEARLTARTLSFEVGSKHYDVAPAKLGFHLDAAGTAEAALAAGRDGGLARGFTFWLSHFRAARAVAPKVSVDATATLAAIDAWEAEGVERPFSGGVRLDGAGAHADPPRNGHVVDRPHALELIAAAFADPDAHALVLPLVARDAFVAPGAVESATARAQRFVAGPVTLLGERGERVVFERGDLIKALVSTPPSPDSPEVLLRFEPSVLDTKLGALRATLESPPEDARFAFGPGDQVRILPSRAGTVLSSSAVATALSEAANAPARIGPLPILRGAEPKLSTAELEALHVKGVVGRFTTFHACCQLRVDNIHRIADLLDGHVVAPGETFSINEFIGPRSAKNGFKLAPTIEEGEMVDSLGGGVSQFATTIFNALFLGGYDIVERVPHTYYFARYPMGRDATLSWPKPDIIFKNDTDAGAVIHTEYTDKSITVKIFGDNGGRKVSFKVSPQQDLEKPPIEYIPDMTQPPEKDKTKEAGQIGWTVFVTREVTFPDGTKKQEKRKVVYKPRVRRVIVHPCKVPKGEPGYTGEKCPEPEDADAG